jgi:hypothetical protein
MNFKHPGLPHLPPQQGMLLQPKQQDPDDFLSSPAVTISGWAFMLTNTSDIRIAFCEQVFPDGKLHPRTAVTLSRENLVRLVNEITKFKDAITTQLTENKNANP